MQNAKVTSREQETLLRDVLEALHLTAVDARLYLIKDWNTHIERVPRQRIFGNA